MALVLIEPDWPAPASVRAFSTTRRGGASSGPWQGLNLADHVGDDPVAVAANRARLSAALKLPAAPIWLSQVHQTRVVDAATALNGVAADGSFSVESGRVCAVLTADCLPLLLCDRGGKRVAALHAGWRGLAAGVLEAGVAALACPPAEILAWIGPCIGPGAFEVGVEVREAFMAADGAAEACFVARGRRWLADLPALARGRLAAVGVGAVYGGSDCSWSDPARFYSYRRDGQTGRQASLIWLAPG